MQTRPLLAIALLLSIQCLALSKAASEDNQRTRLKMLHADSERIRPTLVERAYLDTYKVLDTGTSCGEFYGSGARAVLDEFVIRLRTQTILDTRIGLRMSGLFTIYREPNEKVEYRLFEHIYVNSVGPFFRTKAFPSEPYVPGVGSFASNTRGARALILLHELAHLIKRTDGAWLIPDDGKNAQLSRLNSLTVEARCGEQIRAL